MQQRGWSFGGAALVLAAFLGAGMALAEIRTAPPAGFADLDEPETAPVDLYFGGRPLGAVEATFVPGRITLADPALVVARLGAVRPEAVDRVVAALSGELATHSGQSCRPERFPGCGTLDLPVAGVIFNPDFFRLDLVVAPAWLAVEAMAGRYLPEPVTGPSLIANLSAGGSGSSGDTGTLVAGLRGRLGQGRTALRLDAFAQTDSDRPVVDTLAVEWNGQDHLLLGGLFQDHGTRFSRVPAILGASIETQLDDRLDLDASAGTPILLFLPERSQVELLVEGRLVAVRAYEAGNQRIDTSALPRGAYDVTLRIRGGSGATREESVAFVKDMSFPPPGEWQYFTEAGLVADDRDGTIFPTVQATPVAKVGLSRRLLTALAGTAVLSATDQEAVAETDLRYVLPQLSGGFQLAAGTSGDVGLGLDLGWRRGPFGLGLGGEVVLGSGQGGNDGGGEQRPFQGLDRSRRSLTGSTSYNWGNGARLQFRGYYRDGGGEGGSWGVGPTLTWQLWRSRSLITTAQTSATLADSESLILAQVSFSWAVPRRPLQVSGSLGARWREADEGDQGLGGTGSLGARWRLDDVMGGSATLGGEVARDIDGTDRLTLDDEASTARGSFDGGADLEDGDDGGRLLYRGFARSTLVANRDGIAMGGRQAGDAAILARFDGDPAAGGLIVSSGGGEQVTVAAGSSAVLPVGAFRIYRPEARSAEERILELGQPVDEVPLYPGNVATAKWTVRRLYSLYGRIVRPDGGPLANARIQGLDALAGTDSAGYFVVEIEQPGEHRVEPRDGTAACTVTLLDALPADGGDVVGLGDVPCR